jgi:hypothetical protein
MRYFHNIMRYRSKRNSIKALEVEGVWTEDPCLIRQATIMFFKNQFQASHRQIQQLDGVTFPSLSLEDNYILT